MANNRRLTIEIVGDAKSAAQALGSVEGAADSLDKKTKTSFSSYTKSITDAEGVSGKWSAASGGAMEQVKNNAGALALAGGAAFAALGLPAVHAFEDTAKSALDLSAATGLTTEEASRWIGVADDFGLAAGDVQAGLKEITKNLNSKKWGEYGIATHDAAGLARSSNDILLDTLDVLAKIPNKTEQVRVGTELLGKGFAAVAPMVGKTRKEYEEMLSTVEDGQVITEGEAKKAEKMRLAEDKLSDSLQNLTLSFGGAVAGIAPFVEGIADAINKVDELGKHLGAQEGTFAAIVPSSENTGKVKDFMTKMAQLALATDDATGYLVEHGLSLDAAERLLADYKIETENALAATNEHGEAMEHAGLSAHDMGAGMDVAIGAADGLESSFMRLSPKVQEYYDKMSAAALATEAADTAYLTLMGRLDADDAWDKAKLAIDTYKWKMADAIDETSGHHKQALEDVQRSLADYVKGLADVPAEKKTELYAKIEAGDITSMEQILTNLFRDRKTNLNINPVYGGMKHYASGTESALPGWAWTGEEGPELVRFSGGEKVRTAAQSREMIGSGAGRSGGTYLTIVVNNSVQGSVTTEKDLVRTIHDGIIDGLGRGELLPTPT